MDKTNTSKKAALEDSLKFIDEVKNDKFGSVIRLPASMSTRSDEPNAYGTEEESPLYSICG